MLFHLQALDYESKRDYEFRVEVKNTYLDARFIHGLQFKDYATVKVTVEDVDESPVFTRNPYIIEVHEDTAAGSFVGVVSARDPDADNKPVKYAPRHSEKCFHPQTEPDCWSQTLDPIITIPQQICPL